MSLMLEQTVLIFFVFSFTGWLIEVVFRSVYERRPVNPGFHYGPWLPIYGFCGVVIFIVAGNLSGHSIPVRMLFYFILCSSVEFFAGLFLQKLFNRRYWDYTANRFNFMGYICLKYSVCWVLISSVVEFYILPVLLAAIASIPGAVLYRADIFLMLIISADFLLSSRLVSFYSIRRLRKLLIK